MDDPSDADLAARYRPMLVAERDGLSAQTEASAAARGVVELDQQAVGRLSRMDAIQGQAMQKGLEARRGARQRAIAAALSRIDEAAFGFCEECGEFIGHGRLGVDPCATRCVGCAG